jgi:hypothetical protein
MIESQVDYAHSQSGLTAKRNGDPDNHAFVLEESSPFLPEQIVHPCQKTYPQSEVSPATQARDRMLNYCRTPTLIEDGLSDHVRESLYSTSGVDLLHRLLDGQLTCNVFHSVADSGHPGMQIKYHAPKHFFTAKYISVKN